MPYELSKIVDQAELLTPDQYWWDEDDDASLLPSSLTAFLRDLHVVLLKYDQWLLQPHDIASNRFNRIEEDIHNIRQYCEELLSKVGKPIILHDVEFPDLWCAIDYVVSNLGEDYRAPSIPIDSPALVEAVEDLKALKNIVQDLQASRATLDAILSTHASRFNFIQPILLSVSQITAQLSTIGNRLTEVEHHNTQQSGIGPGLSVPSCHAANDPWTHNFAPMPDRSTSPALAIPNNDSEARLKSLEHLVKSLKKRVVGDGIRIG